MSNAPVSQAEIDLIASKTYAEALADDWTTLLRAIDERDASIKSMANERWKDLYFHAMSIVAETQNALGITPDEASCSNGSAEIIAEIKSLKARALKPSALKAKLADCESALAKTEQQLSEQTLQLRDAREDLANYRASAEEQIAQLKQALAWAVKQTSMDNEADLDFDLANQGSPGHLREILMEAVKENSNV